MLLALRDRWWYEDYGAPVMEKAVCAFWMVKVQQDGDALLFA